MRYNFADISSQRELRLTLIKITFHADPFWSGLQGMQAWKVQTFRRTFHAHPHSSALRGTSPWKVISFKDYLHSISATEAPVGHIGNFLTSHVRSKKCVEGRFLS